MGLFWIMTLECKFGNDPDDVILNKPADETTFTSHIFTDTLKKSDTVFGDIFIQVKPEEFNPEDSLESYTFYDTLKIIVYDTIIGIDSIMDTTIFYIKNQNGEIIDTLKRFEGSEVVADTIINSTRIDSILEINDSLLLKIDSIKFSDSTSIDTLISVDTVVSDFSYKYSDSNDTYILVYNKTVTTLLVTYGLDTGSIEIITKYMRNSLQEIDSLGFEFIDTIIYLDSIGPDSNSQMDKLPITMEISSSLLANPDSLTISHQNDSLLELILIKEINPKVDTTLYYPLSVFEIKDMELLADTSIQRDSTLSYLPWQWQEKNNILQISLDTANSGLLGNWSGVFRYFSEDLTISYQKYSVSRMFKDFYPVDLNVSDYWAVPASSGVLTENQVLSLTAKQGGDEGEYYYYTRANSKFKLRGDFVVNIQMNLPSNIDVQYGSAFFVSADGDPLSFYHPKYLPEFSKVLFSAGFVIDGRLGSNKLKSFIDENVRTSIRNIPGDPILSIERVGIKVTLSYHTLDNPNEIIIDQANMDSEDLTVYLMSLATKSTTTSFTVEFKRFNIEKGEIILTP